MGVPVPWTPNYVDHVGDIVLERDDGGTNRVDEVNTTVSYALSAGIENLFLLGNEVISGTGNASNNTLDGSGQ